MYKEKLKNMRESFKESERKCFNCGKTTNEPMYRWYHGDQDDMVCQDCAKTLKHTDTWLAGDRVSDMKSESFKEAIDKHTVERLYHDLNINTSLKDFIIILKNYMTITESYKEKLNHMKESIDEDILNSLEGEDSEQECFEYISKKYPTYDKEKLKEMIHYYKIKMSESYKESFKEADNYKDSSKEELKKEIERLQKVRDKDSKDASDAKDKNIEKTILQHRDSVDSQINKLYNLIANKKESFKEADVVDTITLNVPLVTRLFEYFLENKMNDEQLHKVLEQLILVSKKGSLTMDNYDEIVSKKESFKEKVDYDKYKIDFKNLSKTDFLNKYKDLTEKDWEDLNLENRYRLNRPQEYDESFKEDFKLGDKVKYKNPDDKEEEKLIGTIVDIRKDNGILDLDNIYINWNDGSKKISNARDLKKESYRETMDKHTVERLYHDLNINTSLKDFIIILKNYMTISESYKEKLKNLREYARTIDVDGQKIVAEVSGSGNKATSLEDKKIYELVNGQWKEVKKESIAEGEWNAIDVDSGKIIMTFKNYKDAQKWASSQSKDTVIQAKKESFKEANKTYDINSLDTQKIFPFMRKMKQMGIINKGLTVKSLSNLAEDEGITLSIAEMNYIFGNYKESFKEDYLTKDKDEIAIRMFKKKFSDISHDEQNQVFEVLDHLNEESFKKPNHKFKVGNKVNYNGKQYFVMDVQYSNNEKDNIYYLSEVNNNNSHAIKVPESKFEESYKEKLKKIKESWSVIDDEIKEWFNKHKTRKQTYDIMYNKYVMEKKLTSTFVKERVNIVYTDLNDKTDEI
jgi:hypothetical protein